MLQPYSHIGWRRDASCTLYLSWGHIPLLAKSMALLGMRFCNTGLKQQRQLQLLVAMGVCVHSDLGGILLV